jgi:hypothetical protein
VRRHKQPFTEHDLERLFHARDVLRRKWDDIARDLPGNRSAATCCWAYKYYRSKWLLEVARESSTAPTKAARRVMPKIAAAAPPARSREPDKRPRYFHEADADIRARIDRQGITSGFFGDPPPGRSALDQKQSAP